MKRKQIALSKMEKRKKRTEKKNMIIFFLLFSYCYTCSAQHLLYRFRSLKIARK